MLSSPPFLFSFGFSDSLVSCPVRSLIHSSLICSFLTSSLPSFIFCIETSFRHPSILLPAFLLLRVHPSVFSWILFRYFICLSIINKSLLHNSITSSSHHFWNARFGFLFIRIFPPPFVLSNSIHLSRFVVVICVLRSYLFTLEFESLVFSNGLFSISVMSTFKLPPSSILNERVYFNAKRTRFSCK